MLPENGLQRGWRVRAGDFPLQNPGWQRRDAREEKGGERGLEPRQIKSSNGKRLKLN